MTGSSPYPDPNDQHQLAEPSMADQAPEGRRWFWLVVGAVALGLVVLVLALRWGSPASPLTIAMVGMAPFIGLPLLFGVVSAALSRSIELRVAAALVAAGYLFTMSPVDAIIGCGGRSATDSITVYTANVQFGVGQPEPTAASIAAADPDVIVLQEASFPFVGALAADSRLAGYEYRSNQLTRQSPRTIIWSRFPIQSYEVDPFVVSDLLSVTIEGPTGPFTVTGVHTLAPVRNRYVPTWNRQFEQLTALDTSTPRLIAGDFNATTDHRPFRDLLDAGWTDVHDEAGCGFDATWPVDQGLPISVMRLDHVLATEHFEILDMTFAEPTGGDHKPVIATLRLR